ncbi:TetR family transcriptional regulator [Prauserella marina]|uniref:DNA-binding transcriptional regulator, AcrR family n=1 Tax=Prauserella marina TaxID=530584 RepID=A0A222VWV4_9PSEU|nr:TetR/AcrR family transcriptional regulator [Prauserella marina]ASR38191.1 TetR family transcriptional regulator [Prauserella marina]PWV78626.1 TetR family transcriptional regulator [Prauserella marina]SDC90240.1 DNA-binding transcriptional regulator, AcrR family [Prauserella marina]
MPKIIGGSLPEHREHVRARVFDALRGQLYERGFDAVTLASVAAEAELGRTAIYNHFRDKEELLVAFVEHEAARYVALLGAAVDAVDDPVEKLATFAKLQLRTLAEYHLPPGGALASALAPSAYRRIAAHADPIVEKLRAILARGVAEGRFADHDPDIVIPMVTAALGARQVVDVPAEQLDTAISVAVGFILRAVGVKTRDDQV